VRFELINFKGVIHTATARKDASVSRISGAVEAIQRGEIVVVADDEDRENEGDLIMAAEAVTPEKIAFYLQHTSGLICAGLTGARCDALNLPPMVHENQDPRRTAFAVSVDVAVGITTGISATDRARTLRSLADSSLSASDFVRPGHVLPLRAQDGGVLKRAGHTEAAVDLVRMAGMKEVGVLCEVVTADRRGMARTAELKKLSVTYGLPFMTVADLVRARVVGERLVDHVSQATIPTKFGDFECHVWRSVLDGLEHIALVRGPVDLSEPALVRVHSECLTGDVFGSRRCDCGTQLEDAMRLIAQHGSGVVVYLRGHEGRGIGIGHKLRAYNLQDAGFDTVDANLALGLPVDSREYGIGAQILVDLGVSQMRLMTNNPDKYIGLGGFGIEIVDRVSLPTRATSENARYLTTKQTRMGHVLTSSEPGESAATENFS
jgi:3,4-dihydroxy 2-butanone 4-phosphate synthase/GTP cyclohydrolase II